MSIGNLKPGDEHTETIVITNTFDVPVVISTVVMRDGALFQGAEPLDVTFTVAGASGTAVCPSSPQALPANTKATIILDAVFPAEAGNEYQGQTGAATVFFTATEITAEQCTGSPSADGGGESGLASTGAGASAIVIAAALVVCGVALWRTSTRRRREGGSES